MDFDFLGVLLSTPLSVIALFFTAKLMGHKQLSQLDFFDYISGITIGSIAAELATELEEPQKPLIALIIYGAVSVLLSIITHKFPKSRKYINGTPTILLSDGKLYRENFKKASLDLSEFMMMCREMGYFNLSDIAVAIFEHNGKLSILEKSTKRPLTPEDMSLTPEPAHIMCEVIMDGRILDENLHRMGLDQKWLNSELRKMGHSTPKDIFLAVADNNNNLTLFPIS